MSTKDEITSKRVPGTCSWFKPRLQEFRDATDQFCLLVLGGPGAGKSALSGWILDEIEAQERQLDSIVLHFFISKFTLTPENRILIEDFPEGNEKYRCTCFDVLRGIFLQLLEIKLGHPALHQRLATTFTNSVQTHASSDLEAAFWVNFEAVAATLSNVVLVVDGLDELEEDQEIHKMIQRLLTVAKTAAAASRTFKVIITSRPLQHETPTDVEKFLITPGHSRSDISTYIEHRIQQLSITERSPFYQMENIERKSFESALIERANGMILWVKLVIEDMNKKKSVPQMESCLESAPKGLSKLYEKLYVTLNQDSGDSQRLFSWLLCAQRPLHLNELKMVLEVDQDDTSLCPRRTKAIYDLEDACGPFVEVNDQQVKFMHHSVRQWMLNKSDLNFSLQQCHREVSATCIAYLAVILHQGPPATGEPFPTMLIKGEQEEKVVQACKDNALLNYAASFWPVHLQGSKSLKEASDLQELHPYISSTFAVIHGLSLVEAVLWTSYFSPVEAKKIAKYTYLVRKSIHMINHIESIQSAVNLAGRLETAADYDGASTLYQEAWLACRSILGDYKPITFECADAAALNLEKAGYGERTIGIYEWMWRSRQQELGRQDEDTLMIAGRLAWAYHRHKHTDKALETYKAMWETWVQKSGHLDKQTIIAAGYYTRALQLEGEDEKAIEVYDARTTAAQEHFDKSSSDYITSMIAMAQALEHGRMQDRAESMLVNLVNDLEKAGPSSSKSCSLIGLDLELARFYERNRQPSDAQHYLRTRWSWYKATLETIGAFEEEFITLLEEFARELERQKIWGEAEELILWLRQHYLRRHGEHSDASQRTILWLAQLYSEENRTTDERKTLIEAYVTASSGSSYGALVLEAGRCLGLFYYCQEEWKSLEELCKQLLIHVWPSILTQGPHMLPSDHRPSAVSLARQLTLCYQKQALEAFNPSKLIDKAEQLYKNLRESFMTTAGPQDPETIGTTVQLGKFYEAQQKYVEAQQVFEQLLQSNRTILGPAHYLTIRTWLKMAQFYERRAAWNRAQQIYEEFLEQIGEDWGLSHPLATEISMNLDRIYQRLGKQKPPKGLQFKPTKETLDRLATSPWNRNEPNDYLTGLLADQVEASKAMQGLQVRILQTQKLYMASFEDSGNCSRATVNHGLRLGNMLEKEGMSSKAIKWYRNMIYDGESVHQDSASAVLHYEPIRRLAHLHELVPADLAVADMYYIQNWNALKSKRGGAIGDASSLRAFRDIFRFYKRHLTMSEKALGLLDDTWAELQGGDRASEHFFPAIETLIHSYASIGHHDRIEQVSRQAVAFLPSGELTSRSTSFLERLYRKLGKDHRLGILRLQLGHQTSLGPTDLSTIANTAQALSDSSNACKPLDESGLLLLRAAYDAWKPAGADNPTSRTLGDILIRELDKSKKVIERQVMLEERWEDCLAVLGPLHHATIAAAKALGKQDVLENIWDAHKERYGNSDPVTLKVGEDLADNCKHKELTIKMYRELFEFSWASTTLGPSHDLTIRFGTNLIRQVYRNDDKEPTSLHNRMFQGLQQTGCTDASALSKYEKLAQSCELQSKSGIGEQPTDQNREIIKFAILLSRKIDGAFASGTTKLLDSYISCTKNTNGNDALPICEDLWSSRDAQIVWHDTNISKVGRELAGLYFKAGRELEAIDLISDVCQHDEGEYGLKSWCTLASYKMLSHFYFERKLYRNALKLHEKILAYFRANYRLNDFKAMVEQFHQKGRALQRLGMWREARGIYDEAFDMTMRYHGPLGYHIHKLDNIKMWSKKGYEGID